MAIELPASLLHIAAQFAHEDPCKKGLTCVHLMQQDDKVRLASTNGHYAFRCSSIGSICDPDYQADLGASLLLPASTFKRKVNYAKTVQITNNEARFYGGKKETNELIEARPCINSQWAFPGYFDSLWPDTDSMVNAPASFTAFNAGYLRLIADIASKWSDNGTVKMYQGDSPHVAVVLTTMADDVLLQWLLLPVMVRN